MENMEIKFFYFIFYYFLSLLPSLQCSMLLAYFPHGNDTILFITTNCHSSIELIRQLPVADLH